MFSFARTIAIAAFASFATLAAPGQRALALDANDVANMAKAQAGDEVIIAQIRATKARFALTSDDIIRLKKEGVSDAVLKVMIESASPAQSAPSAPAAEPEAAPARTAAPEPAPVRVVEREPQPQPQPQPVQTTIVEKHYYEVPSAPEVVYYTAPTTTYYYVAARPVCRPAPTVVYRYDSRGYSDCHSSRVHVGVSGSVRLSRHLSLGFRF